jgi:hypothetical protein
MHTQSKHLYISKEGTYSVSVDGHMYKYLTSIEKDRGLPHMLTITQSITRLNRFLEPLGYAAILKKGILHVVVSGSLAPYLFGCKKALTLEEAVSLYNYGHVVAARVDSEGNPWTYSARYWLRGKVNATLEMWQAAHATKPDNKPLTLHRINTKDACKLAVL